MERLEAGCLAVLLVVAGCNQVVPGPTAATDASEPIVRGNPEYPPGVEPGGVADASALLAAHRAALREDGFVLATETTRRRPAVDEAVRRRVVAAGGLARHRVVVTRQFGDGRTVSHDRWTDGSTAVRRVDTNGSLAGYAGYETADVATLTRTGRLRWFLRRGDFEVTAVTVRDGRARFFLSADQVVAGREDVHLSARLVVTGDGAITALVASVTHPGESGTGRVDRVETYEYRLLERGGTAVDRPAWVPEALAAVGEGSE